MLGLGLGLTSGALRRGVASLNPDLWNGPTSDFTNSTTWPRSRSTISADFEGVADKLVEDATASNTHTIRRLDAGVDNVPMLWTGDLKAAGRSFVAIYFYDADDLTKLVQYQVDLTTGAITTLQNVGGATGAVSASLQGDGFWSVSLIATPNTAGTGGLVNWQLRMAAASGLAGQSYTGDSASGVLMRNFALRRA